MRSAATNQRRSTRNRRNRQSGAPAANQVQRELIRWEPKVKYANSSRNAEGVLILSRRKRPLPTAEELTERKRKKVQVKCKRQSLVSLSHQVITFCNMECTRNNDSSGLTTVPKLLHFCKQRFHSTKNNQQQKVFFTAL